CNHKSGVGDVRAGTRLIRSQNVSANNAAIFFCNVSMCIVSKPISQRLLARHVRIKRVCIACHDDLMKNIPDRVMVGIRSRTYLHSSSKGSATSPALGARGTQQARRVSVLRAMAPL